MSCFSCASFLHYLFAVNPAGPTLVSLIKRVHGMLPYGIIRQTLRMSNAATLLSAVLRIFLQHAPSMRGLFSGKRGQNLLQTYAYWHLIIKCGVESYVLTIGLFLLYLAETKLEFYIASRR